MDEMGVFGLATVVLLYFWFCFEAHLLLHRVKQWAFAWIDQKIEKWRP